MRFGLIVVVVAAAAGAARASMCMAEEYTSEYIICLTIICFQKHEKGNER